MRRQRCHTGDPGAPRGRRADGGPRQEKQELGPSGPPVSSATHYPFGHRQRAGHTLGRGLTATGQVDEALQVWRPVASAEDRQLAKAVWATAAWAAGCGQSRAHECGR